MKQRRRPQQRTRRVKRADDAMTVEELEQGLGIGKNQSYELAHKIGIRVGRRWLIPRVAYQRMLSGEITIPAA
jgi:hypothetical protein